MVKKDGSTILVSFNGKIGKNPQGEFQQTHCIFQDITKHKQEEEELQRSNSFNQSIIDSSPDCIKILDLNGRLQYMSPKGQIILRIDNIDDFLNIAYENFWKGSDYESALTAIKEAQKGHQGRFTGYCPTMSGEPIWWDVVVSPIMGADGKPERLLAVSRDITERNRSELALREREEDLKESQRIAHVGSWRLDLASNEVKWSDELYKMYGFDPSLPPPPYTEHQKLFAPESWERLSTALQRTSETGIPYELELETLREDGSHGWMWVHGETILDASGVTVGLRGAAQDITDRKRVEAENKAILQATRDGFWLCDIKGNIIDVNDALCKMLGYSRTELLAMHISDIDYHDQPSDVSRRIEEIILTGYSRFESKHRCKNGTVMDVDISNSYLKERSCFCVFVRDITERKQAEEEHRRNEGHLRTLVQTIPDFIWLKDPEGDYLSCNPKFERFFGASEKDIVGKTDYDFVEREQADFFRENDRKAIEAGKPTRNEEWITYADNGQRVFLETIKTPMFDAQGTIIGVLGIGRDITERNQAEKALHDSKERFELAMQAASDGIFDWDMKTNQIYYSPGFKRMLGHQDDELENDFSVWERLTNPQHQPRSWEILDEHLQGKRDRYEMEFQMRHKNGHWVDILSRATAYFDENGVPARIVGTHMDITERKNTEKEHKKLTTQLQQAQKMEAIGILAGGIAHDFNNMLGAILGYAEMIRDDFPPGSPGIHDINQVLNASHRAKDLVKQILAFSRQAEDHKIPMQPAVIIKEAINLLGSSLPTTITIKQNIDPDAGVILADPGKIHQVVMNLCTNAFHAMETEGGTLTISLHTKTLGQEDLSAEPHMQPGTFVQLSISDTGTGIMPEIREKIFDPFFTTKEVGKGTGLGLATVHGIVKSCGGSIACDSRLGEGTDFLITLPTLEGTAFKENESSESVPHGKEHILLIDDEEILMELGKTMLERLGYHVTARRSSLEALTTFQNQPDAFDMVITDQTMPVMTGVDLARRILQIRHEMPIILCTGYSSLITEDKAKVAGIKGFAMKPLAKKDLGELIRKILDGKK